MQDIVNKRWENCCISIAECKYLSFTSRDVSLVKIARGLAQSNKVYIQNKSTKDIH